MNVVKKRLERLFNSLKTGDLLVIPSNPPGSVIYSAVLRLGTTKGDFYLSAPHEERPTTEPCSHNPIHWDSSLGALSGSDGEELCWYSDHILVVRGEAMDVVCKYEEIPRVGEARFAMSKADVQQFYTSSGHSFVDRIIKNREAGDPSQQLSLLLDCMGVQHDAKVLVTLYYFFSTLFSAQMPVSLMTDENETCDHIIH